MQISDILLERNQQKTMVMYHGTNSSNIRSILKHGLLANPPKRTYSDGYDEGYETYGGIYLSNRYNAALDAGYNTLYTTHAIPGSYPVVVAVQMVMGSGSVDEDVISNIINIALLSALNEMHEKLPMYNSYSKLFIDHTKIILDNAIQSAIGMLTKISKLGNPVEQAVVNIYDLLVTKNLNDEELRFGFIHAVGADPKFVRFVTIIMNNMAVTRPTNTQINRNIGFRGKTKILNMSKSQDDVFWTNPNFN